MKRWNGVGLYAKLAWRNLISQGRQTLLAIVGSAIGAALIMASVVFFQSFDESGARYLDQHYGPIDWELRPPAGNDRFRADELPALQEHLAKTPLPHTAAIVLDRGLTLAMDENSATDSHRYTVIGLTFADTAALDPDNPLWQQPLAVDQLLLSDAAARSQGLAAGDIVALTDDAGKPHPFEVRAVVRETGITGYRIGAADDGTLVMTMEAARRLAGLAEGEFTSILVQDGREDAEISYFPIPSPLFSVTEHKLQDQRKVDTMKLQHGATFVLCSVTAVVAGSVLMLQLLLMLADSRKESTALLRALGYRRRRTQAVFAIEAVILQGCSLLTGLLVGLPLGYGVILLFQWLNRDLWSDYGSQVVTIAPHVTLSGILLALAFMLLLYAATTMIAAYRLGKLEIVPALRGDSSRTEGRPSRLRAVLRVLATLIAAAILLLHLGMLAMSHGPAASAGQSGSAGPGSPAAFGSWLAASIASLYLLVQLLPLAQRLVRPLLRRLGVGEVAQLLAFRYPASQSRRTFAVMLLFSACFMLLTLIINVSHYYGRDMETNSYTLLGYPAYIGYHSTSELTEMQQLLQSKPEWQALAAEAAVLQPYMTQLDVEELFAETEQINWVEVSDTLASSGRLRLTQRSPEYASDEEAWRAVSSDPSLVILDSSYSYGPEAWGTGYKQRTLLRGAQLDDVLRLDVYAKPPAPGEPGFGDPTATVGSAEVRVIGFAETGHRLEVYNALFVHPQLYEAFVAQGYRWESTPEMGYLLLPLPSADRAALQEAQQQLTRMGVDGFYAPRLTEAGADIALVQTLWMFNSFMILTMGIGLAGLAIVQFRAAQERADVLAMLRCIGFRASVIRQLLLIEGTLIGWLGLLNGWLFGSVGGYMVYRFAESSKSPTRQPLSWSYPWEWIVPVLAGLLLLTMLLNLAPSRKIAAASPAEAIRLSQD
ncbi:ABC transporter permease [Paenibacillus sp. 598K]|uniref:ABC transporter permease n=1 Tax=Paenibacillus sp. 598K TaxID=1117987 RepID=UPI000FFAFBF1|nr:FtsX-like permease family protein [Paenibacillus sp. 598K]GBF77713.1 ABC transporter permease [Paenibacillus sp. 598K]